MSLGDTALVKLLQLIKGRLLQLAASERRKDILIYSSALNQKQNPSLSNIGEGFINWWYIIVEKNPILDMKGLLYYMSSLFGYLR